MARGGVTATRAREAQQALIVHAIGSAAFASRPPLQRSQDTAMGAPHAELVQTFEHGLSWLLAGIAHTAADEQR